MPTWWGKSSSKDVKKTTKENLIDTFHRLISPNEQRGSTKSKQNCRRGNNTGAEKVCKSTTVSRPTSPSREVSRCQSFSADRLHAQPLPTPGVRPRVTRAVADVNDSKPILEKRGKPPLFLPLPKPNPLHRGPGSSDIPSEIAVASVSSNCSADSEDRADSQLQSPVGNDTDNVTKVSSKNKSSNVCKDHSGAITTKTTKEILKPAANASLSNYTQSTPPRGISADNNQPNLQNFRPVVFESAPNSLMSSPSRSPRPICPDHIPTSAFWAVKPHADVTFLGSGQCSSPGSGQTSGHNSVGGDMLAQLFWQPTRGSPECSPVPSPRMMSPGPSSRVHSGSVSPLHPRSGGVAPESPTSRHDDGKKKQTHKLPLPPLSIFPNNSTPSSPISVPRSPGRTENPSSPSSRWKKGKLIGRGTFGHVYVGFNSDSGEMCAMKEVTLFLDDPKSKESAKQLRQEISLLSRLRHPSIVQYYGSEMVDDKLYIYLEYVSGGSIHKLLQEYGRLGEPAIRSYTQQILSGLAYLHAKNTVHRDIKGANILVDESGRVIKLADFGMAKHINGQHCPFSFKGSPYWMAPEVIKNSNGCNLAVDIWSLGCTVLEMATSKPPWSQYEGRVIHLLHKRKKSALFIKLDISKAFDSINWSFLLEVLEALGFSVKWRDWIAALLGTSSSKIMINGHPTKEIRHARGLRQGDPLSPLLFILAIDPLQRIIAAAAQQGILKPVLPRAANLRCSLYADDAAIFANPSDAELDNLHKILVFFGECSGLKINISKTEIFPIRIEEDVVNQMLQNFPGKICKFPGKYLGLPLHIRKLRKIDVQPH